MRDAIEMGLGERKVEVKRGELLAKLRENREKHVAEYKASVSGYRFDSRMPFGVHKDKRLGEVPDDYWRWFLQQDWCEEWPDLLEYAKLVEDE